MSAHIQYAIVSLDVDEQAVTIHKAYPNYKAAHGAYLLGEHNPWVKNAGAFGLLDLQLSVRPGNCEWNHPGWASRRPRT